MAGVAEEVGPGIDKKKAVMFYVFQAVDMRRKKAGVEKRVDVGITADDVFQGYGMWIVRQKEKARAETEAKADAEEKTGAKQKLEAKEKAGTKKKKAGARKKAEAEERTDGKEKAAS